MRDPGRIIQSTMEELAGCFDDDTEMNVKELVECGEPGVALEVLCSQLVEFDVAIPFRVKEQLAAAAELMEMEIEELQELRVL